MRHLPPLAPATCALVRTEARAVWGLSAVLVRRRQTELAALGIMAAEVEERAGSAVGEEWGSKAAEAPEASVEEAEAP